ncbi:MAG: hypothetical protein QGH39_02135 [Candidatus Thermoplasmatota archaeon]|nr:hypothetical protein [Candidatus Thermoplasmatota archaeon]
MQGKLVSSVGSLLPTLGISLAGHPRFGQHVSWPRMQGNPQGYVPRVQMNLKFIEYLLIDRNKVGTVMKCASAG